VNAQKGKSKMTYKVGSLAVVIVAGALAAALGARAQDSAPPPSETSLAAPANDLPLADFRAFDKFAVAHPEVISDLSHNPRLIEDQHYLAKHLELRDFLGAHAELRAALIDNPGDFIEPRTGGRPPQ
jgi:hypothetical protein